MVLRLIRTFDQAEKNIHQYNADLPNSRILQQRLRTHLVWYYSPRYNELAPSKFIGFIGMNGEKYANAEESIFDGGRTEGVLHNYFDVISNEHELYQKLQHQLFNLLRRYNKSTRSNVRLNIPKQKFLQRIQSGRHNPPWAIDELILALDLYFRLSSLPSDENHPEIVSLSKLLNRLPIHPQSSRQEKSRNPNGVYMKLCNFLRLDPSYRGRGLDAGSKLDEVVWKQYVNNREELSAIVEIIRNEYRKVTRPRPQTSDAIRIDEDEEFPEGRIIERLHRAKERSARAARVKKQQVLAKTGALKCEACTFDFQKFYGDYGVGFAECHHIRHLQELRRKSTIKLEDLSIVCANCHRMLHRIRPWITVQQLHTLLKSRKVL